MPGRTALLSVVRVLRDLIGIGFATVVEQSGLIAWEGIRNENKEKRVFPSHEIAMIDIFSDDCPDQRSSSIVSWQDTELELIFLFFSTKDRSCT
jgi:hypothetical protein